MMCKSCKVLGTLSGDPAMDLPYETMADFSILLVSMEENRQGRQPDGKTGAAVSGTLALLMAAASTDVRQHGLLNSLLKTHCLQRAYLQGLLGTRFLTDFLPAWFIAMQNSP